MTFPEFMEAIVRIVDKASPAPPLEVQEDAPEEPEKKVDDNAKLPKIQTMNMPIEYRKT